MPSDRCEAQWYACFNLCDKFRYRSTPLTVTVSLWSCPSRKGILLSSIMVRFFLRAHPREFALHHLPHS